MKLIYCEECGDMVKLTKHELRKCRCGKIRGCYLPDGGHAEVSSNAISVVIGNPKLKSAIREMRSLLRGKPDAPKAAYKKKAL